MDTLINLVVEKTGIPKEAAEKAVSVVLEHIKNSPTDQITKYLGTMTDIDLSADTVEKAKKGLSSLFSK